MADQKSRGGQKESAEKQHKGKQDRDVHLDHKEERDITKEDAARGQQGNDGGYAEGHTQKQGG